MRSLRLHLAAIVVASTVFAVGYSDSADPQIATQGEATVRLGVFDSRAVAIAYYRSEEFKKLLANLHSEHAKAKAAGDDKRVKQLEDKGKSLNDAAHKQGFGAAPVDSILATIKDELAATAKAANVDVIVSKWDLAFQRQDARYIDVTDRLVKSFRPTEVTLKMIQDIQKLKPIPGEDDRPK